MLCSHGPSARYHHPLVVFCTLHAFPWVRLFLFLVFLLMNMVYAQDNTLYATCSGEQHNVSPSTHLSGIVLLFTG
ncbi:hypothetical protein BDY19DRAFT_384741 [Irpex rosettiformis]|uniref:Uncharacterized protein n=1 Tax=Irpex rosettiformis TaxID=378272 RepID=A0ACB8TV90_9APHY|nr:hypothetical protein BDY19DRAFT_384741 [Irpex rosettiformis]